MSAATVQTYFSDFGQAHYWASSTLARLGRSGSVWRGLGYGRSSCSMANSRLGKGMFRQAFS